MNIKYYIKKLWPRTQEQTLMFCLMLSSFSNVLYANVNTTLGNALGLFCFVVALFCFLTHIKNSPLHGFIGFLYAFLLFWTCIISIKTFLFETDEIYNGNTFSVLQKIFSTPMFVPCLIPFFVLFFPRNRSVDLPYLVKVSLFMAIIHIILFPVSLHSILNFSFDLNNYGDDGDGYQDFIQKSSLGIQYLMPPVIMIYFKKYLSYRTWMIFVIVTFMELLIAALMARRGGLLITATYMLSAYALYIFTSNRKKVKYIIYFILFAIVLYIFLQSKGNDIFSLLLERGDEDTRSGVEYYFYKDMDFNGWLFGRGWFGTYYDQIFGTQRYAIETGYLSLILRGGFLYLIPYVLVIVLSALKGIFHSKNILIKAFAIVMLISVLELKPYGWPAFNLKYFIVWLGVYLCNTKQYRYMSDTQIERLFK